MTFIFVVILLCIELSIDLGVLNVETFGQEKDKDKVKVLIEGDRTVSTACQNERNSDK